MTFTSHELKWSLPGMIPLSLNEGDVVVIFANEYLPPTVEQRIQSALSPAEVVILVGASHLTVLRPPVEEPA